MGGLALSAVDLGLRTRQGYVYRGFNMTAAPGSLNAICGPAGSGRSSMLMTIVGRMKFTEGRLIVEDQDLPKAAKWLRYRSAVAPMGGFLQLESGLRVHEEVNRACWLAGRKNLRPGFEDAAVAAGLDAKRRQLIRDLTAGEKNRLAVASAFVQANAQLVVVDDLGVGIARDDQAQIWQLLRDCIAATGVTVIATSLESIPAVGIADQVIEVAPPSEVSQRPDASDAEVVG